MAKAGDIGKSILQQILVQEADAPFEPDEIQDTLKEMNRFMATQAAKGLAFGYTNVTSVDDDITIPDGALDGFIFGTAIRLAAQFGKIVEQSLRDNARDGLDAMRHIAVKKGRTLFPGTLPRGSGNEDTDSDDHFYHEHAGQILTEQNGPILLEDDTDAA